MRTGAVKYSVLAAGMIAGLTLWGWLKVGTAGEWLPEEGAYGAKRSQASPSYSEEEAFSGESGSSMKYDESLYLRSAPMADPFRLGAAAEMPLKAVSAAGSSVPPGQIPKGETLSLKGILSLGQERRAVLQSGNASSTVKEGDQFGRWTIGRIGRMEVTLYGSGGNRTIPLER